MPCSLQCEAETDYRSYVLHVPNNTVANPNSVTGHTEIQSDITSDAHSAGLFWCQAPLPIFSSCLSPKDAGTPCLTIGRMRSLQFLLCLANVVPIWP
jgi:hypothetical protein